MSHLFQSTRPVWGATPSARQANRAKWISIHAPRVGRDNPFLVAACCCRNFNPRAPCGARPAQSGAKRLPAVFQSTRPVWGATEIYVMVFQALKISIHAPRVGRDHQPCCQRHGVSWHFNPRAPCGARLSERIYPLRLYNFNPRAPCGARRTNTTLCIRYRYFNPRAPCGARP